MNITKINPIGYEVKTEKGNTYKKSNMAKSGMLAGAVALNVSSYIFKDNKFASMFSCRTLFEEIVTSFNKTVPAKLKTPLAILGVVVDFVGCYLIGKSIDNSINRKRAIEADNAADSKKNAAAVDKK